MALSTATSSSVTAVNKASPAISAKLSGVTIGIDLDEVLGGVRALIPNDKKTNIIDVDDQDMLIDYEQFSRMLLGVGL